MEPLWAQVASDPWVRLAFLLILVLLPPVLFAVWLRNAERRGPEPWGAIWRAMAWGASVAVVIVLVLESIFEPSFDGVDPWWGVLPLGTVVLAPLVEETTKAAGILLVRGAKPGRADGFVYGGAVGVGFAATENILYVGGALLLYGESVAVATALFRAATVALHGAASAVAGWGVWHARFGGRVDLMFVGLIGAISMHAAYNAIAGSARPAAFILAAIGAFVVFIRIRRHIRQVDAAHS